MTCHSQDILPCIRKSEPVKPSWEGYPISMDRNIKGVLVEIHSILFKLYVRVTSGVETD